jgi:hypothetical protein
MTSPIDTFMAVQFIANAHTPPNYLKWNGKIFGIPPEYQTALGSGQDNPGILLGIRGYLQVGGPTGNQWVMAPSFPPTILTAFNAIPLPHTWLDQAALNTYQVIGLQLVETYNVAAADAVAALQSLYTAARDNEATQPPGG